MIYAAMLVFREGVSATEVDQALKVLEPWLLASKVEAVTSPLTVGTSVKANFNLSVEV